jgi:hypothetical protein
MKKWNKNLTIYIQFFKDRHSKDIEMKRNPRLKSGFSLKKIEFMTVKESFLS